MLSVEETLLNTLDIIVIDTETTGKYPLKDKLCEVAAVRYNKGRVVGEYGSLINPELVMSDEVIAIHNITNDMAAKAPKAPQVLEEFYNFISNGIVVAHHAPFDLGFLMAAFEEQGLPTISHPVFCTSLIGRKVIKGVPNHRLQTLVKHFNLDGGNAHRALDDAKACLGVFLECLQQIQKNTNKNELSVEDLLHVQGQELPWDRFSIKSLQDNKVLALIIEATQQKKCVSITYEGGSKKSQPRRVYPVGLVRNPNGDFLVAFDETSKTHSKRYFLDKISTAQKELF